MTSIIGKKTIRVDAIAKVTGTAEYIADINVSAMLYAKALRAGVPHARILSIDTSEAESMPGVRKVVTGNDRPMRFGDCLVDQPPVAVDKVRHAGEAVAVVIAESANQAKAAAAKIKVEYAPLPYVLDPIKAAQPDAPLIHEPEENIFYEDSCIFPIKGTNVFQHFKVRKEDISEGFTKSDVIVESDFEFPLSAHCAMEPHGCICRFRPDMQFIEIWASHQGPFVVRDVISRMFDLPTSKVRVHSPFLGGAFGGKSDVGMEPLAVFAASFVPGYAVKLILTREEVFSSTLLGRGMKGHMKIGATKDGMFQALESNMYFSDGAYGDTSAFICTVAAYQCTGPYEFPYCSSDVYGVYTNSPPVGAMRAYGHPEGQLMVNRLIYMMAKKLDMPYEEIIRKNLVAPGKKHSNGFVFSDQIGDLEGCFDAVTSATNADKQPKEDEKYYYGTGSAATFKAPKQPANSASTCQIRINDDGSVFVGLGGIEMGQGVFTVYAQMAAEALQVPIDKVQINQEVDTLFSPWEWMTVSSLQTYRGGRAIQNAASNIIKIGRKTVCEVWNCEPEITSYADGVFTNVLTNQQITLADLAKGYSFTTGFTVGEPLQATGWHRTGDIEKPEPERGIGSDVSTWTFGAQACNLRVEKATGKIEILHFASAFDLGKAINPSLAKIQIHGGVVQALGGTLMEEVIFKDGVITNDNFYKYKIPRLKDINFKHSISILETPINGGPWGARPLGEHPVTVVAPVVMNALADATGIEFTRVPLTPDVVLKALSESKQRG